MPTDDTDYCSECDAEVPADAKKCPECGIEFEDAEAEEGPAGKKGDEDLGEDEDEEERDDEEKGLEEDVEEEDEEDEDVEDKGEDEGEEEEEDVGRVHSLKRDRLLFYTGLVLIMIGGPGLAFGSWLHDALSIPVVGETYAAFGWINVMFAVAGVIAMVVGILLLVLSLRGGAITQDEFEKLKAEGLT